MNICICVYIHTSTCTYCYIFARMCTNTLIHIYMYIYTCKHRENVAIIYLCMLMFLPELNKPLKKKKKAYFVWVFLQIYYGMETMEIIHYFPFFFQLIMSFTKVALSDTALKIPSLMLVSKVWAASLQLQIAKHRSATVREWHALARVKSLIRTE